MEDRSPVGIRPALPFFLLFMLFGVLGARLFYLQVFRGDDLAQAGSRIRDRVERTPAPRGRILDREGRVLAFSRVIPNLVADPREIRKRQDPKAVAALLAKPLNLPARDLAAKLQEESRYEILKKRLTAQEADQVRALIKAKKLLGLSFEEESIREYPYGSVAAQTVGFCGSRSEKDKSGNTHDFSGGLYGIEARYDEILRGKPGVRYYTAVPNPHEPGLYRTDAEIPPEPGADVVLTLDGTLATIVHQELEAIVEKFKPQWATAVLLDPQTGEILAMENAPNFDPNRYGKFPVDSFLNRAISYTYTPGSVFKPFVMGAAVEEGKVDLKERIDCENGEWVFQKRRIHDHEREGILEPRGVMARSSNIGMAKIALRLGCDKLERYVRNFEFGRKTGVELPGETIGLITARSLWTETYTLCSVSFGHEISVTPLRLASSFSLFANGGNLLEPRLLERVEYPDGREVPVPAGRSRSVLSKSSTAIVKDMLAEVMISGTGKPIASSWLKIAGKTGTTVKDQLKAGKKVYTSTFAGFAPVESPRLLVLVVVDEPRGAYYGSQVAAPAAVRILERGIRALGEGPGPEGIDIVGQIPSRRP